MHRKGGQEELDSSLVSAMWTRGMVRMDPSPLNNPGWAALVSHPCCALCVRALPAVREKDVVRVASGDFQLRAGSLGAISPRPPHGPVWRLGAVVQQPGSHMAELVAERALQFGQAVHDLGAQLHSRRIPVGEAVREAPGAHLCVDLSGVFPVRERGLEQQRLVAEREETHLASHACEHMTDGAAGLTPHSKEHAPWSSSNVVPSSLAACSTLPMVGGLAQGPLLTHHASLSHLRPPIAPVEWL